MLDINEAVIEQAVKLPQENINYLNDHEGVNAINLVKDDWIRQYKLTDFLLRSNSNDLRRKYF